MICSVISILTIDIIRYTIFYSARSEKLFDILHELLVYYSKIMSKLRNIVVTGSNKGIGYGIVEKLASKNQWNIIMACRNKDRGNQAK